jgi:glycosyltransferase involved in cell wall biosynthesis
MNTAILAELPSGPRSDTSGDRGARVKVCHVSLTLCTGGLERLLVEFARWHDRSRFELEFVALGDVGRPANDIRDAGCEVTVLNCERRSRYRQVRELAWHFRDRGVDVVHTHNAYPHLYGTLAARLAGVPAVIHTRHGRRFGQTWRERLYFAAASRLANRVVAVSEDTGALCRRLGWLDDRKVARIYNGIDIDRFAFRGPTDEPRAISVGRLSPEKDFATLLRAVALVVASKPDFRLLLVGDGPERAALERLSSELKLSDHVQFFGERNDVAELLSGRGVGFFVASSLTEGVSLTLLEAMAAGLPVVATNVGGNPEIVVPDETGLLVPSADPAALAEAMLWMSRDPFRRVQMGSAGRRRVERQFSVRGMIEQYEALYEELLSARPRQ